MEQKRYLKSYLSKNKNYIPARDNYIWRPDSQLRSSFVGQAFLFFRKQLVWRSLRGEDRLPLRHSGGIPARLGWVTSLPTNI